MRSGVLIVALLLAVTAVPARGRDQRAYSTTVAGPLQSGRIFAADSYSGDVLSIYEITGGQRVEFAKVTAGGWIGPLAISPDGRLFAVTNAQGGSLWDVTSGGDLTGAKPLASNLFPQNLGFLEGLAFDATGNAYITNSESGTQPIARVTPSGAVSYLPQPLSQPRGLAVIGATLYACESGTGRVVAVDLASGQVGPFATGFNSGVDHTSAQLVVDPRGHLLLLWAAGDDYGLYDVTGGGNFSGRAPLAKAPFRIDVNQIAADSANSIYAAGDGDGAIYVSRFNGAGFAAFTSFVSGVGDTESVVVVP